MGHLKKRKGSLQKSECCSDVGIGLLPVGLKCKEGFPDQFCRDKIDFRYIFICSCSRLIILIKKSTKPGRAILGFNFVLWGRSHASQVYPESQSGLQYLRKEKTMAGILKMVGVEISVICVSVDRITYSSFETMEKRAHAALSHQCNTGSCVFEGCRCFCTWCIACLR